jgi:hypothetical protein
MRRKPKLYAEVDVGDIGYYGAAVTYWDFSLGWVVVREEDSGRVSMDAARNKRIMDFRRNEAAQL